MGGKCCGDRCGGRPADLHGSDPNAYDTRRPISIGYHSKGGDAERFDKAFQSSDLKEFVELLKSSQPIESFEDRMHPWAEDPRTVGALAGTQLAILASVPEEGNGDVKARIREAGGIPPLVDFLRSEQSDRVQTAVVALSFLTADCPENTVVAFEAGALELLLRQVDSPVAGMRAAAATTLRNICMESHEYRRKFVQLGGISGLVRQLPTSPDAGLKNHADVQLEAVLNLQDLIENEDGTVIEEFALEAVSAGAEAKLQALARADDEEVRASAEEVLASLAKAQRSGK